MTPKQVYYCDKCGFGCEDRFTIEYHESVPDPRALPVKVGDQIWVNSWISPEMEVSGETESPVLRTITAITIAPASFGYEHQWEIHLDRSVMVSHPDGYHCESSRIDHAIIRTISGEEFETTIYQIRAMPSLKKIKEMKISFYKDFSG